MQLLNSFFKQQTVSDYYIRQGIGLRNKMKGIDGAIAVNAKMQVGRSSSGIARVSNSPNLLSN